MYIDISIKYDEETGPNLPEKSLTPISVLKYISTVNDKPLKAKLFIINNL